MRCSSRCAGAATRTISKSFEPRAEDPDFAPNFDALQYLIERAHQGPQPLQVHAWLATLPIWDLRDTPPQAPQSSVQPARPVSRCRPIRWLMYRDDGETWAGTDASGHLLPRPRQPRGPELHHRDLPESAAQLRRRRHPSRPGALLRGRAAALGLQPDQRRPLQSAVRPRPGEPPRPERSRLGRLATRPGHRAGAPHLHRGQAIKPNVAVTAAVVTWGKGPQSADDWQRQPPTRRCCRTGRAGSRRHRRLRPADGLLPRSHRAGRLVRRVDARGRVAASVRAGSSLASATT